MWRFLRLGLQEFESRQKQRKLHQSTAWCIAGSDVIYCNLNPIIVYMSRSNVLNLYSMICRNRGFWDPSGS